MSFEFKAGPEIYVCEGDTDADPTWGDGGFQRNAPLEMSPAAAILSYGFGIFEGLKAHRGVDGVARLFRPFDGARRLQRSAEILLMPPLPEENFIEAAVGLVERQARELTEAGQALYLRPQQHCIEPMLGAQPGRLHRFVAYASKVNGFFAKSGPLRMRLVRKGRCAPGGSGASKAAGNYAAALPTVFEWRGKGYDDVLFMDAHTRTTVTEASGANIFACLPDGRIVTPALTSEVLAGITRHSAMTLLREQNLKVEEGDLTVDLLSAAHEVFLTGTAYTVRSIGHIDIDDTSLEFESTEVAGSLLDELQAIQQGRVEDTYGWTLRVDS